MVINGFSNNQRRHADIIWNLPNGTKVLEYVYSLDGQNFTDAQVALNMLAAEAIDTCDVSVIDITDVLSRC